MGKCTNCGGSGRVRETHLNKTLTTRMGPGHRTCPSCGGSGSGDLARLMSESPDRPNAKMCRKYGY